MREKLLAIGEYRKFRDALAASDCRDCTLASGRNRIVVDRGNPKARVMAVGEGPGAEEDERGLAFVGRGGRLFDRLMAEAGIDTNRDLLIANVVKCRPPGNRVPLVSEAEACLPFLRHQIRMVGPEVIILLGATSLRFLLPLLRKNPMKALVGKRLHMGKMMLLITVESDLVQLIVHFLFFPSLVVIFASLSAFLFLSLVVIFASLPAFLFP